MANILIGYDLNKVGQDYTRLIERIQALSGGSWWHGLDSTWIILTELSTVQVRDDLRRYMDENDELFVVDITGQQAAWSGFPEHLGNWLNLNL